MDAFTLEKIEFDAVRRIVAGFCSCSLGRAVAMRIEPSTKLPVIHRRLEATGQMVEAIRTVGTPPLGGAADISSALKRAIPGGGAGGEDFAAIASTLAAAGNCRAFLLGLGEHLTHLHKLAGGLGDFSAEIEAVRAVIAEDGTIRDDASAKLGKLRSEMAEVTRRIHDVIHGYLRDPQVRKLLTAGNVTLHGDRYVLPVRADNRGRLPGVVHRASNTGATVFVEPNASVELNNRLVDLHDHERQEIQRLLAGLAVKLSARTEAIETALRTLGQLDLLAGKAQYAYQFDMTCPEISPGGTLEFYGARHPLLEFAYQQADRDSGETEQADSNSKKVVPIDVRLGGEFDILVITGSNTGGKTVTLKTVALMAVMAQAGLHLPVRPGAKLPVLGDILIEIGDEQSLQQSLSTFGGHVQRLKNVFGKARRNSLVLLDELGSGTDPDEGGAIGQAVLDELRRIGCLAMVTTHFSVLKAYALNNDRVDNASVEFDTQTLRPTYHLRIGTAGQSHAITVAAKLGLAQRIVASARRHMGRRGSQFRKALRATGVARQDAETARSDAAAAEQQALAQTRLYETKLADLRKLKEEFSTWLARLSELKDGDEIFVPSAGRAGRLARLELHRQIALVDIENVQHEVPLVELMPDLGQGAVRRHLTELRSSTAQRARTAQDNRVETDRLRDEAKRLEAYHRKRARRFDTWLGAIAHLKVGDVVPINRKPGRGKIVGVDLAALRADVEAEGRVMRLSIQDLFPQVGPFAAHAKHGGQGPKRSHGKGRAKPLVRAEPAVARQAANRPVPHRRPDGKAARKNLAAVLATQPGEKVFVVPFNAAATLIRIDEKKQQATVSRGAFEMQVALADVEPVGYKEN